MIDLIIVLAFIAYSISQGFISKSKASKNLVEYFLAGRSIKGWKAGISMAATQYAADTPLLVTGLIATGGIFMIWRLWIYGLAFLLLAFVLSKSWWRSRVITDAELTEIRYSGKYVLFLRGLKAIFYGTMINCVVLAMVLIAATRISEIFLVWNEWLPVGFYDTLYFWVQGLGVEISSGFLDQDVWISTTNNFISIFVIISFTTLYSTTGGLRSVIATDVVQFFIAMVATLIYAIYIVREAGGLGNIVPQLIELYGQVRAQEIMSFTPSALEAIIPFAMLISLQWFFQMNSDGTGYLAQRTMACRSDKDARHAGFIFTVAQVLVRSLFWLPIALALLVLYPYDPALTGSSTFVSEREITFISGIKDYLPVGAKGLMLTGMLAALASTIDTHLSWGAGYWSNDLYKRLISEEWMKRKPKSRELVLVARISNIVVLLIALVIMVNLNSIQNAWYISLLFGAGVGSVLVLRWLWERINIYSEIAAIASSIIIAPLILYTVEDEWLKILIMALASTTVVITVTLLTPRTDPNILNAFYKRIAPPGYWVSTAQMTGQNPKTSINELWRNVWVVILSAGTIFTLLVGISKILMPAPEEGILFPILLIVTGIAIIPLWWRRAFPKKQVTVEQSNQKK
nr:Na+:solute symporter [Bacteroidota bacterium]